VFEFPSTDTPLPPLAIAIPAEISSATPTQASSLAQILDQGSALVVSAICLVTLFWAAIAIGVFIYIQKRNS
jgi:hypothetical protein